MTNCGSTRLLGPIARWGCNWTQVKSLNSVSSSGSGNYKSGGSLVKQLTGIAALLCLTSAKRPVSKLFLFSSRPTTTRSRQLRIRSTAAQLNDEQAAAVQTQEDCVRVVAGPGSGKTLVLTHRIAHLIQNRGIDPSNLLCLTFTNKAKDELKRRLGKLLGGDAASMLTVGTFHSVCVTMLRENVSKEDVGVDKDFVIYDNEDCIRIVKNTLKQMIDEGMDLEHIMGNLDMNSEDIDDKTTGKGKRKVVIPSKVAQNYLRKIYELKEFELRNFIAKQNQAYRLQEMPPLLKAALPQFNRYQRLLKSYNAVDFDDLIHLTVRMLYRQSDLCEKYRNRWSYVLADEFQDTDWAQYVLVRLLCATSQKLFVVGDVDQAIYGWRGADYKNMEDLQRHFHSLATFELRRNYRSSQSILKLASEVINRSNRSAESLKPLKLQTMKPRGPPVTLVHCLDSEEEASYVLDKISSLVDTNKASYDSFGILYRTRAQGQTLEKWCIASQIPYTISGSAAFLNFKEVKDLRAYLQLIWNPEDRVALDRIINTPPRGLGPKTLKGVELCASNLKISFSTALQKISKEEISHKDLGITLKAKNSLLEFCKLQENLLSLSENGYVGTLIKEVMDRSQIVEYYKRLDGSNGKRARNLQHFQLVDWEGKELAIPLGFEHGFGRSGLGSFLQAVALNANLDQEDETKLDAVRLSTLHAAKGLEFDYVFIIGVEEGNLPLFTSDIEEERRLFYVGVTRARKELIITRRQMTFVPKKGLQPTRRSQFLDLPGKLFNEELMRDNCFEISSSLSR